MHHVLCCVYGYVMAGQLLYLSRFAVKEGGHGGNRRTRQMAELLSMLHVGFKRISPAFDSQHKQIDSYLFTPDPAYDACYNLNTYIAAQLAADAACSRELDARPPRAVVIDDPIFFPETVAVLSQKNIPMVSVVHNLESLLPRSFDKMPQWNLFNAELHLLRKTNLCVTISLEDSWLLQNFGIENYYYPYFPAEEDEERLAKIRIARRGRGKKFFASYGTVYNRPTLLGMKQLAHAWPVLSEGHFPLVLSGYGVTQFIKEEELPQSVKVMDCREPQSFDNFLADSVACILHQESGSGSLTKIPELLRVGVPVVASRHASRTYTNDPGVYVYQEFSEIPALLQRVMESPPPRSSANKPSPAGAVRRIAQAMGISPEGETGAAVG